MLVSSPGINPVYGYPPARSRIPLGRGLLCQAIFLLFVIFPFQISSANDHCHPVLWPFESALYHPSEQSVRQIEKAARTAMKKPVHAIANLGSAGKTSLRDSQLLLSRQALQEADHAAVLALAYALTQHQDYLDKSREILLAFAKLNQPTGHPIDETRLDGMIWAYDLIACKLSAEDNKVIRDWFENMRQKKLKWKFGSVSSNNNHRIHQLKMLLLLDKILNHDLSHDRQTIEEYSHSNINSETGVTQDYLERDALYYHNYVLQAWLEIALISQCCKQPVEKAFDFLVGKISSHQVDNEFSHSRAKIDKLRGNAGFAYAKKDGKFDIYKTAPAIIAYYTINKSKPDDDLWSIQAKAKSSPKLSFMRVRRELW